MRRSRRIFLTTCAVISVLAVFAGVAVYVQRDEVEAWLRNRAIALYLKKIAPELPFVIESFEIRNGDWRDFLNWKIPELALVVRRDDWRARLTGPIEIKRSKAISKASGKVTPTETNVTFKPKITVERISEPLLFGPFESYIASRIFITGDVRSLEDLADIRDAKIAIRSPEGTKVTWAPLGVEVLEPAIRFNWVAPGGATTGGSGKYKQAEEGNLLVQASAKGVNWAQPGSTTRMATLVEPKAEAEIPFAIDPTLSPPVVLGPVGTFRVEGKSGETLWDDDYANVPWVSLPLRGKLGLSGFKPDWVEISLGPEKTGIDLSAKVGREPYSVSWKTRGTWKLADWVKTLLETITGSTGQLAKLNALRSIGFKGGSIHTKGSAAWGDGLLSGEGRIKVTGLDLDFPGQAAAVRGVSLELEADSRVTQGVRRSGLKGAIEIPALYYKKAKGKLGRVPFFITPDPSAPTFRYRVQIGDRENLPLEFAGIPMHVGAFQGTLDLRPPEDSPEEAFQYSLFTQVEVPPLGLERFSKPFCLSARVPPGLVSVRFPQLELSNGTIDPEGSVRLDLFDGQVTVSEIGIYDLLTDAPEVDFDLDIHGVRLDQMGAWSGLGEVGGTLEGYAHDVTIVSWLPTRFDFRLEAKPYNRSVVVFSPEAMENFIKIIADDAMDQLPGIAKWFFFGFPEKLIGGYDVKYVGISAFSKDGNILLETIDSPEEAKKGNHFILFGPRFKMPLRASHYPLIVDNTAMGNFVRQKFLYLKGLADQKRLEKEAAKKEEKHDDSQETCLPDVLSDHLR